MPEALKTDIHTHLIPRLDPNLLEAVGFTVSAEGRPGRHGHVIGPADLYAPERLAGWLGRSGLDRALVSVPPPMYVRGLGQDLARQWVRSLNDALREDTRAWAGLDPLGYLPLDEPEIAVEELRRLASEGWTGVTACAGGGSLPLHAEALGPVWSLLAELQIPLVLHPGSSPDERLQEFYLENLLGNPQESTLAVAQLVFGRVLASHPGMRIAIVHGGGLVPAVAGRWQRGIDTLRPGLDDPGIVVWEELSTLWVDCLTHDSSALDLASSMFGEGHVLLGSDWPFPMGTDDPIELVAHRGEAFVDRVATINAAEFLGGR